jgi:hypothetical protein
VDHFDYHASLCCPAFLVLLVKKQDAKLAEVEASAGEPLPWAEFVETKLSPAQGVRLWRAAVRCQRSKRKEKSPQANRAPERWWLSTQLRPGGGWLLAACRAVAQRRRITRPVPLSCVSEEQKIAQKPHFVFLRNTRLFRNSLAPISGIKF